MCCSLASSDVQQPVISVLSRVGQNHVYTVRCIDSIFGREINHQNYGIYGVYIRFWPIIVLRDRRASASAGHVNMNVPTL